METMLNKEAFREALKPDPQVELAELKFAVKMFCVQIEACHAIAPGLAKELLKAQMDSAYYKLMKSKS